MENSLQETAGSFSLWGMKLKSFLALVFCSTLSFAAVPLPAQAQDCPNGICEVVFEYTGSGQYFDVPFDAVNLTFELSGGSGGRGGNGGRVIGEFLRAPSELWVHVGGAGAVSAEAAGGFNGGGRAGGSRGNEGSGGGASDIRTGEDLSHRIVVAGGGGGGYSGAAGGIGGNVIAANGGSGQGSGGTGGSETTGGDGGASNGGSASLPGAFGVGGTGGTSWNAGGGGGGGGWYGGGGGGADSDSCCSDAGGGGGGSSYADAELTDAIQHQAGVQSGAGRVIIRYQIAAKVTAFTALQQSSNEVLISVETDGNFTPSAQNLTFGDIDCSASEPQVADLVNSFTVTGCSSQEFRVSLNTGKMAVFSQSVSSSISLDLDLVGPEFSIVMLEPESHQYLFELIANEEHFGLSPDAFAITGCAASELIDQKLSLNDCGDGEIAIELAANSTADYMGNQGPARSVKLQFTRDTVAPTAAWAEPIIVEEGGAFDVTVELRFDDVLISEDAIEIVSDEIECVPVTTIGSGVIVFEYVGCAPGIAQWRLPVFSLVDLAGNLGPVQEAILQVELILTPAPAPAPVPLPVPLPEPEPEPEPAIERLPEPQPAPATNPNPIQPPIETPEAITPDIRDEILDFIEGEEPILEQPGTSSQAPTVISSPTESENAELRADLEDDSTPEVSDRDEPSRSVASETGQVELDNLQTDSSEKVIEFENSDPPYGQAVGTKAFTAELALAPAPEQKIGFLSQVAPLSIAVTVISGVGFAIYRKMMVR